MSLASLVTALPMVYPTGDVTALKAYYHAGNSRGAARPNDDHEKQQVIDLTLEQPVSLLRPFHPRVRAD